MRAGLRRVVGLLALSGCALLGKSEPVLPRYFSPEYPGEGALPPGRAGPRVRLGRVEGWSHLRERLVVRSARGELVQREDWRWMERPEVYLRRALARTLFEERGAVEVLTGRAPALEVELIAFEEREAPRRARVELRLTVWDEQVARLAETVIAEQPVEQGGGGRSAAPLVEAFARALRAAVTAVADRVLETLADAPPGAAKGGGS